MKKQIELAGREVNLFLEQVSNLGLKEQIVPLGKTIDIQDDQNWAEVLSRLTRDTLLREAYLRMEKAEQELSLIEEKLLWQIKMLNL